MNFGNGDEHLDDECNAYDSREQPYHQQHATEKFGAGREVAEPRRQAQAADHLHVSMNSAEDLGVAVRNHNDPQDQPQR